MKILLVAEALHSGGAERQMVLLMNELVKQGHAVSLFTWIDDSFYQADDIPGVTWIRRTRTKKWDLNLFWSLGNLIRKQKYDVVQGLLDNGNLYACVGSIIAGRRKNFFASERSGPRVLPRFAAIYKKHVHRLAAATIANSETGKQFLKRIEVSEHKVKVIRNAFEVSRFLPQDLNISDLRNRLGLSVDNTYIVCVARITSLKNQLGIVQALKDVKPLQGIKVIFIGKENPEYKSQIVAYINEAGLEAHVEFLGVQDRVEAYLWSADLGVLFSDYEGSPNVPVEASIAGLPFISSDVGDVQFYQNPNMQIIQAGDIEGLTQAIQRFLNLTDKEKQSRKEQSVQVMSSLGLGVERMAAEYLELYQSRL